MTPDQQADFFYAWPKLAPQRYKYAEYNHRIGAEFRWYWAEIHSYSFRRHWEFLRGLNKTNRKLANMAYSAFLVQTYRKNMRDFEPEEMGFCVCHCARCNALCRPVRSSYHQWPIQTVEEYDASKLSVFSSYFCRACLTKTWQEERRLDEVKEITKLCNKLTKETKRHVKNQNDWATAGISCQQSAGGIERTDGHRPRPEHNETGRAD